MVGKHLQYLRLIVVCCGLVLHIANQNVYADNNHEDSLDIKRSIRLKTVTIFGNQPVARNNEYEFGTIEAKSMVSLLGGTDVIRYIGTLPGVSQGMDGGLGFYVRGANNSNNRIELDNVPVYGTTHLFGLFSVYHPDMVGSVNFKTGSLSASSGDFLASLTRIISLKPDSMYHAKATLSPFFAGLSVNGPVSKHWGLVTAGRLSVMRPEYLLLKKMTGVSADINPQVGDMYLKLHGDLSNNHKILISGFYSNDYLKYTNISEFALNWGNNFLQAGWDWKLSEHTKLQTSAYVNRFFSRQQQRYFNDGSLSSELKMETKLQEMVVQSNLYYTNHAFTLNGGISAKKSLYNPASEKVTAESGYTTSFVSNPSSELYAIFGEAKVEYSHILASIGLRSSLYFTESSASFPLDLHVSISWRIRDGIGIEGSFDRMNQTHHSLEGLPTGWSLDLLIPADGDFRPEQSDQWYAGGYWRTGRITLSSGIYYKTLSNLVSYKNASNVFGVQNTSWKDEVAVGNGNSYGLEVRMERRGTIWNAACSYTLSKTTRQFDEINDGKFFPFKFDRRHILNAQGQWLINKKNNKEQIINFSAAYYSGHNETLQTGIYKGETPPYWDLIYQGSLNASMNKNAHYRQLMSGVNAYQMPDYFRMDAGYTFRRIGRKFTREFTIGVYNMLNRKNPYLIFYENGGWKQLSIFPIVPSFEWSLFF